MKLGSREHVDVKAGGRAIRGKSAALVNVDGLRDYFCSKPFDYAFTAYYPKKTIDFIEASKKVYGYDGPAERVIHYTCERLERCGYRGWYVIAVHDSRRNGYGSNLWHPHMMLDGRNDQMARVRRAFHPVADINCELNGPIEDLKAWGGYCAARACEYGMDVIHHKFDFMGERYTRRVRGSRGKGRGRSAPPEQSSKASSVTVTGWTSTPASAVECERHAG